jgi:acetylornithine deacetylase/succinyl-diaminopimelate desuccinylase-like protein
MASEFTKEAVAAYADASREKFEKALREIVEIPTVSVEPERKADMARGARYAAGLLESLGGKARVYETGGHPLVHGRFDTNPSYPTATIYNHLDVQPAEGEDWKTEPFKFTRSGDAYFGRGTTDDKGPAISALFGAKYAVDHGARVNVHFLWELEEEIGSPHFEDTIRKNAADFATDSVVVSDTVWVSRRHPACPAGLRGLGASLHAAHRADRPACARRGRGAQSQGKSAS